jgi:hypothetical protein
MTGTTEAVEILKTDALGRVRVTVQRREALLDEFERGEMNASQFAEFVGVKYQTFATWLQKRRRERRATKCQKTALPLPDGDQMRWAEAVLVNEGNIDGSGVSGGANLNVILPGGARIEIAQAGQTELAADLILALQRRGATLC